MCVVLIEDDELLIIEGDVDIMIIFEIKIIFKEMGIVIKCRREDKLREIFRKVIFDNINGINF